MSASLNFDLTFDLVVMPAVLVCCESRCESRKRRSSMCCSQQRCTR